MHEERCVKNVLKSCGQYIERLSFPDYVMPSKLSGMLQLCVNLIKLSIPTSKLSYYQLEKAMKSMKKLQSLDILWKSDISSLLKLCMRLKEVTVRLEVKKQDCHQNVSPFESVTLDSWLNEWVIKGLKPLVLNIIVGQRIPLRNLLKQ